jgi:hypothetical protein
MTAKTIKDLIDLTEVHHVLLPQRRAYPAVIFFETNSERLTTKDGDYADREDWGFLICAKTTNEMFTMTGKVMEINNYNDGEIRIKYKGKGDIAYDEELKIYYKQLDYEVYKNRLPDELIETAKKEFGAKYSGTDGGKLLEISVDDDFMYVCVKAGDPGVAIWKRTPLKNIS